MIMILSRLSHGIFIAWLFQWKSWKRSLREVQLPTSLEFLRGPRRELRTVIMQGGREPTHAFLLRNQPTTSPRADQEDRERLQTGARDLYGSPRLRLLHHFLSIFLSNLLPSLRGGRDRNQVETWNAYGNKVPDYEPRYLSTFIASPTSLAARSSKISDRGNTRRTG